MARRWQIIDDDGRREVLVDHETGRVISGIKVSHERKQWPAFTQLVLRSPADSLTAAIEAVAGEFDLPCRVIGSGLRPNEHAIELARVDDLTLIGEPNVDFEDRFVTAASSEALIEHLETEGIHFGYDPTAGSLHLTKFVAGGPVFTWCDSLQPGPSFALTFHADGKCTEQDPRRFALQRMQLDDERACLDRRRFVLTELEAFGVENVDPDFRDLRSRPIFGVETDYHEAPMMS